jgi:hypothetical protein
MFYLLVLLVVLFVAYLLPVVLIMGIYNLVKAEYRILRLGILEVNYSL